MKTWASRISDLRDKRNGGGMTLKEIGDLIGLSPSSVCDLEQGRIKSPGGDAALKLDSLHTAKCARAPRVRTTVSLGR